MTIQTEWRDYDVVVVGSGGAGSAAAHAAAESGARVLVVSKDPIGCSDTKISEGVITVLGSGEEDDSEQELSDNLRMGGGSLPVEAITDTFASDSQSAYDWARSHGLRPSINQDSGKPKSFGMALGGHTKRRAVGHKNSGVAFGHANWSAVVQGNRIDYQEDAWFLDLVTEEVEGDGNGDGEEPGKRVVGGLFYDAARGLIVAVRSPAVIIAAGGISTLYFPKTDTMRGNTGDSYAVAARAGADLVDMEQVQFLPFCLATPPAYEGLLAGEPTTASYLGVLRDKNGKVILDGIFLRTRAECSSAIMRAVEDGRGSPNGGAYLDLTANEKLPLSGPYFMRALKMSLPSAYRNAREALGKAAAKCEEPWEVRPAAHYMMGGIRADRDGASVGGAGDGDAAHGIAGLFSAGQAMGGVFGANRLGSTALSENVVFGIRSGQAAAAVSRSRSRKKDDSLFSEQLGRIAARFGQVGSHRATTLKLELQKEAWDCIGPVRTAERLGRMEDVVEGLSRKLDDIAIPGQAVWNQAFMEYEELRNMIIAAQAVTAAARERDASVGGHVRLDGPTLSPFSEPYSTVVSGVANGEWRTRRVARSRIPLGRLLVYLIQDRWRKTQIKIIRMLPESLRDKVILNRYLASPGGKVRKISPGSAEGAVAEAAKS
ncbi:MAG: FAD-binding protein [Rhodospirillaceae bacterium]|jgi:succinate dehydrogenase/fumarate reductase flavoprotein subunit|nr:FAD-binding protein [Rhodospirillaceae bacterium]MBT4490793.1 FAD-binding protein [Rhodospirillaceae bacterium]